MIYEKPEPIAAVEDTRELVGADRRRRERAAARSTRTAPRAAIAELRDRGVEALTVSLLNSFANPAHERAVAGSAREEAPALPVSISSEILPEFREYERTVTTVMNAYVVAGARPVPVEPPRRARAAQAPGAELQVVRSDGGLMSLDSACAHAGPHRAVRARRRRQRRRRSSPRARASTASSPSTWAAPRPTSPSASAARRRSRARPRSASSRCGRRRSTSRASAPAAARSPTSPR